MYQRPHHSNGTVTAAPEGAPSQPCRRGCTEKPPPSLAGAAAPEVAPTARPALQARQHLREPRQPS
eukprot:364676-Chlamydomonas_euryale.AAC.2